MIAVTLLGRRSTIVTSFHARVVTATRAISDIRVAIPPVTARPVALAAGHLSSALRRILFFAPLLAVRIVYTATVGFAATTASLFAATWWFLLAPSAVATSLATAVGTSDASATTRHGAT